MKTRDFLVEIGTEELPPKSLAELSRAFTDGIVAGLDAAGLKHGKVTPYATPRRLAVRVARLAGSQPDQRVKRKGPPVTAAFDANGAPTRAAIAFAESCGTSLESLSRVEEARGAFLFYEGVKPGAETASLLPGIVQASLDKLPIAKRMRWGSGSAEFVRPVHWVVMLFGRDVVPCTLFDVPAGDTTRGHRFHAPRPFRVTPATSARWHWSLARERRSTTRQLSQRQTHTSSASNVPAAMWRSRTCKMRSYPEDGSVSSPTATWSR